MNKDTNSRINEIKRSFRLFMNGVTAQSMRDKGIDYHINWGASLMHLREMASEYPQDCELAQGLWQENVRECKIMATMLMPKEDFAFDTAMQWIEQTRTTEIADIATMNLYCHLPYAAEMAMSLINKKEDMMRHHGFTILSRLFANGEAVLEAQEVEIFLNKAVAALSDANSSLRRSAWNSISHFADLNEECHIAAQNALKSIKRDDWL